MIVRCGVNGERVDEGRISVCHHCGMPLCEEHGWVVASDDAFAGSATAPSPAPDARAPAATVPVPAMHCRDCVDKFHGGATKRRRWADPGNRSAAAALVRW